MCTSPSLRNQLSEVPQRKFVLNNSRLRHRLCSTRKPEIMSNTIPGLENKDNVKDEHARNINGNLSRVLDCLYCKATTRSEHILPEILECLPRRADFRPVNRHASGQSRAHFSSTAFNLRPPVRILQICKEIDRLTGDMVDTRESSGHFGQISRTEAGNIITNHLADNYRIHSAPNATSK